jgi:hypothetical protein
MPFGGAPLDARGGARYQNAVFLCFVAMPKPRFHIRHLCRTYYLSEWWDE